MSNEYILYTQALNNLKIKEFELAIKQYKQLLLINNKNSSIWFDLSYLYLINKKFLLGWKYYEKRLNLPNHSIQTNYLLSKNTLWNNEDLTNRSILIFHEQGFGDTIQFIRFIDNFKNKYPHTKIIIHIQNSLLKLIKFNYKHIKIISELKNIKYDYSISLLSLPFKLNYLYHTPLESYLTTKGSKGILNKNKLNIGICWQGNMQNSRDKQRSINLNLLLSILSKNNIQLYSLQKDIRTNHNNIIDSAKDFNNFNDSASFISSLDLVVTIDTSIAHLSGALGIKTYLILPYLPDYRWGVNDTKSYWYYNTFIFRQKKSDNWTQPLIELNKAITTNLENNFLTDIQNGLFYQKENNLELSNFYFKKALNKNKTFAQAYIGLGNNFIKLNKYFLAKKQFKKAIKLDSTIYEAYNNIATIYEKEFKLKKAIKFYKESLKINPNYIDTLESIAEVSKQIGDINSSIHYYKLALKIESNNPTNHMNLAIVMIMSKRFRNGWKEYEHRWDMPDFKRLKSKFTGIKWKGENINNKTLLIFTEQGFGDSIQFIRLVENIKEIYPKTTIILQSQIDLTKLFDTSPYIDKSITWKESYTKYDYYIPLISLPIILKLKYKNIPNKIPYLFPRNKLIINKTTNLRIGIVWSGSDSTTNEIRSVKLSNFKNIFKNENCDFYSLQVGAVINDLKAYTNISNLGKNFNSFYDTAQTILNLDLVITIDTAVAHLSGALNIPTWVILPSRPGYLWMQKEESSPWYPSIKLYRQKKINKWDKLFKKIEIDLKRYIKNDKKN